MPSLGPTAITGRVAWLGLVASRETGLASIACDSMKLSFSGPEGEDHGGLTRPSCSRVAAQYPVGTEIRNTRQLSVISTEEMADIAEALQLDTLDPCWLGATMVVVGIPDFSHLPPSSRLQFADGPTITVDMENQPCNLPAKVIQDAGQENGRKFKIAAHEKRGVTAWVEREGIVRIGDRIRLHVPGQRSWRPEA